MSKTFKEVLAEIKFHEVDYHGTLLLVPKWTRWIAMDRNGAISAFKNKPIPNEEYKWWDSEDEGFADQIHTITAPDAYAWRIDDHLVNDWQDSLVEYPE